MSKQLPKLTPYPKDKADDIAVDKIMASIRKKQETRTPEEIEAAKKERSRYDEQARRDKERMDSLTQQLTESFHSSFKDRCKEQPNEWTGEIDTLEAPTVLAHVLQLFDHDETDVVPLYLEWMVDRYVGNKMVKLFPVLENIYLQCMDKGYTDKDYLDYSDDNKVFYIPHDHCYVVCVESQNANYLFAWGGEIKTHEDGSASDSRFLHIRRYWDDWVNDDEWSQEEDDEIRNGGMVKAIVQASDLAERYSDNVGDNEDKGWAYTDRPNLKWFMDRNFRFDYSKDYETCGFGDCRDPGYCSSFERFGRKSVEKVLHHLSDVKWAIFYLYCSLNACKERTRK